MLDAGGCPALPHGRHVVPSLWLKGTRRCVRPCRRCSQRSSTPTTGALCGGRGVKGRTTLLSCPVPCSRSSGGTSASTHSPAARMPRGSGGGVQTAALLTSDPAVTSTAAAGVGMAAVGSTRSTAPSVGERSSVLTRQSSGPASPPQMGRQLTVLVVDDEATQRLLLRRMLEKWGLKVVLASDGRQALRRLARARDRGGWIDCVVSPPALLLPLPPPHTSTL